MTSTASTLHDKLLNTYTAQHNKLLEDLKKTINVLNKPKMLSLGFTAGHLTPMPALKGNEEPEKTIAERIKLNLRKTKRTWTGLEILTWNKLLTRLPI